MHNTPEGHVTRDYKEGLAQLADLRFKAIDTSGLEPSLPETSIQGRATALTQRVLRRCDVTLFLLDGRCAVLSCDPEAERYATADAPVPPLMKKSWPHRCHKYPGFENLRQPRHNAVALSAPSLSVLMVRA